MLLRSLTDNKPNKSYYKPSETQKHDTYILYVLILKQSFEFKGTSQV